MMFLIQILNKYYILGLEIVFIYIHVFFSFAVVFIKISSVYPREIEFVV